MRRAFLFLTLLVGVLAIAEPVPALVPPPDSCLADPAVNGTGVAAALDPDDGYGLDRMTVGPNGRLHTISVEVVDNSFARDRVRRFLPDGSPDPGFGADGAVDLPGEMLSSVTRNLAVDDLGRVWVMRSSFSNVIEIRRLLPDGQIDASLDVIEFDFGEFGRSGFFGDMVADGDGIVVGFSTRTTFAGLSSLRWHAISSDGVVTNNGWSPPPGPSSPEFGVFEVTADGWLLGGQRGDSRFRPLAWHPDHGSAGPWIGEMDGLLTDLTVIDGTPYASGYVVDDATDDLRAVVIELSTATPGPVGVGIVETDLGGPTQMVLALDVDRTAVVLSGESGASRFGIGRLEPDGTITVRSSFDGIGEFVSPPAHRRAVDGRFVVAGYMAGFAGAFTLTLTPDLPDPVSASALDDQVSRLYTAGLGRIPDGPGAAFWRQQRAGGLSVEAMAAAFASSVEFVTTYGPLTDRQFVEQLYENVLGRPGEPAGVEFWTGALSSGALSRAQVLAAFADGAENIARTGTAAPHDAISGQVHRLYWAFLGRDPEPSGRCFWYRSVVGGVPVAAMAQSFADSDEFAATYGPLTNRQFVELVYENVLGRPGDQAGVDFWTDLLDRGVLTRGEVMLGFSEAPEFVALTGTLPATSR